MNHKKISCFFTKMLSVALIIVLGFGGIQADASTGKSITSGSVVRIVADQALTYPVKTSNNTPKTAYYPLPKGTVDTVVGKRIKYVSNGTTKYYYKLKSGLRVLAEDVKLTNQSAPKNNSISSMTLSVKGRYTYITLETNSKVPYKVERKSDSISFKFSYTTSTPGSSALRENNLFSKANWTDDTLKLSFKNGATYMGYSAYYDNDNNLVLRFSNLPSSIKNAYIAVDAGHGGKDKGAVGDKGFHEKDINLSMAKYLVEELEERGATTILLDRNGIDSHKRRKMAEEWDATFFISIHSNSAPNTKATGTEVYYFRNTDKQFAAIMSKNVSSSLDTLNRGAKAGIFNVTLSPQMPSLLVETGFMSNTSEYKKLKTKSYQKEIAQGIADSIEEWIEKQ